MKVLVTYANQYSFEQDNKLRDGVTFNYFITDTLDSVINSDNSKGYKIAKGNLPINRFKDFVLVPGYYDADFSYSVGKTGKPELVLLDLKFVSDIYGNTK